MKPLIVITTLGENFDARRFAGSLVERRLAGCVNILPAVYSTYRWKGNVAGEYEQLLLIKTCEEKLEELKQALLAMHPYEVPELVVLPAGVPDGGYLDWLTASLG